MEKKITVTYADSACGGIPIRIDVNAVLSSCSSSTCAATELEWGTRVYKSSECASDYFAYMETVFAGVSYLVIEDFTDYRCGELTRVFALPVDGVCKRSLEDEESSYILNAALNGTVVTQQFEGSTMYNGSPDYVLVVDLDFLTSHLCDTAIGRQFYHFEGADTTSDAVNTVGGTDSGSSASGGTDPSATPDISAGIVDSTSGDGSSTSKSNGVSNPSTNTGTIIGIVAGCMVAFLVVATIIMWRRLQSQPKSRDEGFDEYMPPTNRTEPNSFNSNSNPTATAAPPTVGGLWNDEVITTARIPRAQVKTLQRISRGGYGEVYRGTFNGDVVAVKMLLPETCKSVKHVNTFLAEVKMMATMDHPRIVQFVGVAWDALTNLCVVSEFMAGGDLRDLLTRYHQQDHPVGFDRTKVTIAFHIAHALTYMHSLVPAVIHRDLKSENILLSAELDAKLTDFGISREHVDRTMTVGVGTSLWMAPEAMLGERYDDKADMFSFGVVLSELDTQTLPYAHAKENNDFRGRTAETAIFQMVAVGKLCVRFSPGALQSVVELGLACISLNPKERPSAADALGKLQRILKTAM